MDYSELLFAATVYNLARTLRTESMPEDLRGSDRNKWRSAHPASKFVPEALKQIHETAGLIRAINLQPQPK